MAEEVEIVEDKVNSDDPETHWYYPRTTDRPVSTDPDVVEVQPLPVK